MKVLNNFEKSQYHEYYFEDIFIYYFIKNKPKKAFEILMDSINNCKNIISEEKMCLYFSAKEVLNSINYNKNVRTPSTINKYIRKVKKLANDIENNNYIKETNCKFDVRTNYFIIEESYKITVKNWSIIIRRYFYDDGEYRIYADNQLGYNYKTAFVKSFCIEYDYDLFSDYVDGIYTITRTQYNDFYRGKNIEMNYNRDGEIFMLKKSGYYCFIRPSTRGLSILNGGALKSLNLKDVNYYYDNMDSQILLNKEPLEKYTKYQKIISNQVKEIGGSGTIHGSIIDIDFFNHIYVNPFDGTLSGYYAFDIIDKFIFSNIPSLLKVNCPTLYKNYVKRLGTAESNALVVKGQSTEIILEPTYYPSTDIYKASREIKKMQRLNNGILTVWHDDYRKFFNDDNIKLLK